MSQQQKHGNQRKGLCSVNGTLFLDHETPPHAPKDYKIVQQHVKYVISPRANDQPITEKSNNECYVPIREDHQG